jgi:hypothetical protein
VAASPESTAPNVGASRETRDCAPGQGKPCPYNVVASSSFGRFFFRNRIHEMQHLGVFFFYHNKGASGLRGMSERHVNCGDLH